MFHLLSFIKQIAIIFAQVDINADIYLYIKHPFSTLYMVYIWHFRHTLNVTIRDFCNVKIQQFFTAVHIFCQQLKKTKLYYIIIILVVIFKIFEKQVHGILGITRLNAHKKMGNEIHSSRKLVIALVYLVSREIRNKLFIGKYN